MSKFNAHFPVFAEKNFKLGHFGKILKIELGTPINACLLGSQKIDSPLLTSELYIVCHPILEFMFKFNAHFPVFAEKNFKLGHLVKFSKLSLERL